jgi:hypothetical protein
MRIMAIVLVVLALVIGIAPQYLDCQASGREPLKLANGNTVPMKCLWTAHAEAATALPMLVLGSVMTFSRRRESRRALSLMGIALGVVTILLPTTLIGVCASNMMVCNSTMKPLLILAGSLVIAVSVVSLVLAQRTQEPIV